MYASVNITTIRLFNPDGRHFTKAVENWNQFATNTGLDMIVAVNKVKVSTFYEYVNKYPVYPIVIMSILFD